MSRWVAVPARGRRALPVHRAAPCRPWPSSQVPGPGGGRLRPALMGACGAQQGTSGGRSGGEHPASQGPAPGSTRRDCLGACQCHSHRDRNLQKEGRGCLLRRPPCLLQASLSCSPHPASLYPAMPISVFGGVTAGSPVHELHKSRDHMGPPQP